MRKEVVWKGVATIRTLSKVEADLCTRDMTLIWDLAES